MKFPACFLLPFFLCASPVFSAENPYDVVGKTIAPFVKLFLKGSPDRAVTADLALIEMTGIPPEFSRSKISLALETPDKFRVRGPVFGEEVAVCRNAQEIWAAPGTKIEALIGTAGPLPKPPKSYKLGKIELPIPEQQLVFLPALLQVRDVGETPVNGVTCRVLDVTLLPELAKALKVEKWTARAWVRPDYTPARITLAKPQWHIAVDFEKMSYAPSLPSSTWLPTPEQAGDVMHLDATRFKQLLDAAANGLKLSS